MTEREKFERVRETLVDERDAAWREVHASGDGINLQRHEALVEALKLVDEKLATL